MDCIFTYFIEEDTNEAYIFSALDNKCSLEDFDLALSKGKINQQFHDALVENTYAGATAEKPAYWLTL